MEALGDCTVANAPRLHSELLTDVLPSHTPAGRLISRGPRADNMSEVLAAGQIVHPAARANLRQRRHPDVVSVPISDAPPTRTGLVVCSTEPSDAACAFVAVARLVLARHDRHAPEPVHGRKSGRSVGAPAGQVRVSVSRYHATVAARPSRRAVGSTPNRSWNGVDTMF